MTDQAEVSFRPTQIIKEGYLTKSPPLDGDKLIKKRFRLRWFVLCYVDGEPVLFYFKDEKSRKQGRSKGHIPLVGVEVFKQDSKVNGFPFVINIQTADRLYHLCSTQQEVHKEWLEKLRKCHVPNIDVGTDSSSSSCTCAPLLGELGHPVTVQDILLETKQQQGNQHDTTGSNDNEGFDEDDEYPYDLPYATKPCYFTSTYTKQTSAPTLQHNKPTPLSSAGKSRSLDIRQRSYNSDVNRTSTLAPANKCATCDHERGKPRYDKKIIKQTTVIQEVDEEKSGSSLTTDMTQEENIERDEEEEEIHENEEGMGSRGTTEGAENVVMLLVDTQDVDKEVEGANTETESGQVKDKINDSSYVTMTDAHDTTVTDSAVKASGVCESEDEGIGRSDSDSSGNFTATNTNSSTYSSHGRRLLEEAIRISSYDNDLLKESYVGPRLMSNSKYSSSFSRSRSLDDLLK